MTLVYADTTIPVNPPQLAYELSALVGETVNVFTAPPALADCLVNGAEKTIYADDGGLLRRVVQDVSTAGGFTIGADGTHEMRGQSFVLTGTADVADSVDIYMYSRTGAPADSILVELLDTSMTGTVLGTSATILASALTTSAYNTFTFGSPVALSAATTYYLRISRTGAFDAANVMRVGESSVNPYSGGTAFTRSGGVWSANANDDLQFRVNLEGNIDTTDLSNAITAHTSAITSAGEPGDFGYRLFNAGNATVKQLLSVPNLRGYDMNLRTAGIHVNTAPTGHALTADIYLFDASNVALPVAVLGRLSIPINGTDSTLSTFTALSHWPIAHWPNGYTITAEITAVGSGTPGADLTFQVQAAAA